MTSPFGLNVLSSGGVDGYPLNPAVMLFMDDFGAAQRFAASHPDTKVIHRTYSGNEATMHLRGGETLNYLKSCPRDSRVYINLACEPSIWDDDSLRKLIAEQLAAMQWAVANGVKVAGPHGAFYGITPAQYPLLDPLADYIAEHPDLLLFTCDEYAAGHMFSGVTPGGETGHIYPDTWVDGTTHYHCGRITDYFADRVRRGKKLPLTIITEFGLDDLSDVKAWTSTLIKSDGYPTIRGWKSLRAQHIAWYGLRGWSPARSYGEMLKACWAKIYSRWKNVLGVCIYCWGSNNDRQWDQFRVDGETELFNVLATYQGDVPVAVPIPTTSAVSRIVKAKSTTRSANVRSVPTTQNNTPVGVVEVGDVVSVRFPASPVTADSYSWVYLESPVKGWLASVVDLVEPSPVFGPAQVDLGIPFQTQNGWQTKNLCGPASEAMIVGWANVQRQLPGRPTAQDVVKTIPNWREADGTTYDQIVTSAQTTYSLTLFKKTLTIKTMQAELDAGRPFIVSIKRNNKYIPETSAIYALDIDGNHIMVVGGYGFMSDGNLYFIVYDPLGFEGKLGDGLKVRDIGLLAAMTATGYLINSLTIDPLSLTVSVPDPETSVTLLPEDVVLLKQVRNLLNRLTL